MTGRDQNLPLIIARLTHSCISSYSDVHARRKAGAICTRDRIKMEMPADSHHWPSLTVLISSTHINRDNQHPMPVILKHPRQSARSAMMKLHVLGRKAKRERSHRRHTIVVMTGNWTRRRRNRLAVNEKTRTACLHKRWIADETRASKCLHERSGSRLDRRLFCRLIITIRSTPSLVDRLYMPCLSHI
jgi:hypothetical protein